MRSHNCPKCQAAMVEGFVAHEKHGMPSVIAWLEGTPRKGWWRNVKTPGTPIQIATWRCHRCGYLENYARA